MRVHSRSTVADRLLLRLSLLGTSNTDGTITGNWTSQNSGHDTALGSDHYILELAETLFVN
jgi:hypothetical protein